jgi:NAD(P)-dependent dehydrogenase (short-subunit alcohol dehydrogenase family)
MTERGTIIVTGGSRGIGAAICRRLAADGYAILVNYSRDPAPADAIVHEIVTKGGRAYAWKADVADPQAIVAMFEAADRELGPLAALVNNAGIVGETRRADAHDAESLTRIFAVNVVGPMLCAKEAIRRLSTKSGGAGGAIVNIGSIAATTGGIPGMVAYSASKGATASFTLALAKEVAGEGIRVNAVAPGMIVTDMTRDFADRIGPTIPIGRCGTPDEIAAAVAWLISPDSSYALGTILTVSGGR